jgi:hypothetical protein
MTTELINAAAALAAHINTADNAALIRLKWAAGQAAADAPPALNTLLIAVIDAISDEQRHRRGPAPVPVYTEPEPLNLGAALAARTRGELIEALQINDRHGCYTDQACWDEGLSTPSHADCIHYAYTQEVIDHLGNWLV